VGSGPAGVGGVGGGGHAGGALLGRALRCPPQEQAAHEIV